MRWSEYSAKTVARIQARGMPIDMALWNLVQENKAAVIGALIARFDPSQGSEYPDLFSRWRMQRLAIRAVADLRPASRTGRDWIPARCSSTATRSA